MDWRPSQTASATRRAERRERCTRGRCAFSTRRACGDCRALRPVTGGATASDLAAAGSPWTSRRPPFSSTRSNRISSLAAHLFPFNRPPRWSNRSAGGWEHSGLSRHDRPFVGLRIVGRQRARNCSQPSRCWSAWKSSETEEFAKRSLYSESRPQSSS